jgi:hypothetical protein
MMDEDVNEFLASMKSEEEFLCFLRDSELVMSYHSLCVYAKNVGEDRLEAL